VLEYCPEKPAESVQSPSPRSTPAPKVYHSRRGI